MEMQVRLLAAIYPAGGRRSAGGEWSPRLFQQVVFVSLVVVVVLLVVDLRQKEEKKRYYFCCLFKSKYAAGTTYERRST